MTQELAALQPLGILELWEASGKLLLSDVSGKICN